jgi:hypothetical protein
MDVKLGVSHKDKLRVFENRVLRRIFGRRKEEVNGGWRKLHNEELQNLHSSPNIIRMIKPRRMRWAWHVTWMGKKRNAYKVLVGTPEETARKTRHMWEDIIKMAPKDVGWSVWTGLLWLRIVTSSRLMVMNFQVP